MFFAFFTLSNVEGQAAKEALRQCDMVHPFLFLLKLILWRSGLVLEIRKGARLLHWGHHFSTCGQMSDVHAYCVLARL